MRCLSEVHMVQAPDEVDHITPDAASREAVPEVAIEVDDEGTGVVTAVERTGAD